MEKERECLHTVHGRANEHKFSRKEFDNMFHDVAGYLVNHAFGHLIPFQYWRGIALANSLQSFKTCYIRVLREAQD